MRKTLKRLTAAFLAVLFTLSVSSCSLFVHPIDAFKAKIALKDNFETDIAITDIPLIGSLNIVYKKDGDKTFTSGLLGADKYTQTVDGVKYKYTKSILGKWTREEDDGEDEFSAISDEKSLEALFNSSNYTEENEGVYSLNSDVEISNMSNVKVSFEDDDCLIDFTYNYNGIEVEGSMKICKIGETTVDLPNVE